MPVLNGTGQLAACARPVMAGHASRPSAHGPGGVRGGQAWAQAVLEAQCCNAASANRPCLILGLTVADAASAHAAKVSGRRRVQRHKEQRATIKSTLA